MGSQSEVPETWRWRKWAGSRETHHFLFWVNIEEGKGAFAQHLEEDSKVVRISWVGDQHTGLVGFCLLLDSTKVKLKQRRECSWLFIFLIWLWAVAGEEVQCLFFLSPPPIINFRLLHLFGLMMVRVQHVSNNAKQHVAYIYSLICKLI